MAEVRRHLWRLSNPTPLVKQCHLQQAVQDPMQSSFEYPQSWRVNLSEKPVPVSDHPHHAKVSFLCLNDISCVSVCAHCLLSSHWTTLRKAWLHPLFTFLSAIYVHS